MIINESKINEGNGVSSNIPGMIDNFLQDVAQMTDQISYNDIIKLGKDKKLSAKLGKIKKLKNSWGDVADDDNYDAMMDIGRKVKSIINERVEVKPNGKEISERELYIDSNKYRDKYSQNSVEIYELPTYGEIHPGFGINWKALGTQTVEVTKNFVKALNAAIKDVEMLNKKYEGTKIIFDER